MDVQSITQVNSKWIFTTGDGREKADPETLREIRRAAIEDAAFYERMKEELNQIIDREREKLQKRYCPTKDEIDRLPLGESIAAKIQREYYLRDANAIGGIYSVLSETFRKHDHCIKIARQARAALEG